MKQIFRHLMGEYNGEILKALCYYHNVALDDLIDIFYYWATVQWLPPGKGTSEASEIRQEDAVGIAHTAGFFSPVVRSAFMSGSVRFAGENANGTDSSQSVQAFIDGVIRYITNEQLQNADISTFAKGFTKSTSTPETGKTLQTFSGDNTATQVAMVPPDVEPIGYLVPAETVGETGDTMYLDEDGEDHITGQVMLVDEEPESGFYLPYYGPEYAWLDKAVLVQVLLEEHQELFMTLLECLQHIRFNGGGMIDFLRMTEILMGEYLKVASVEPIDGKPYAFQVWYCIFEDDTSVPVMERLMRFSCWEYFVEKKYPQFKLSDGYMPQLDCVITFENNEWSLSCTVQPTAEIYYTTDGSNPKYSPTRVLYDGESHYVSETVHLRAYSQGGWFDMTRYASSNIADEELVPSHLYYDGTITYNGDNTYRG